LNLRNGSVVIAAITSCTNTSNPSLMLGAGLAGEEGCRTRTASKALGEDELGARIKVVTDYLLKAGSHNIWTS